MLIHISYIIRGVGIDDQLHLTHSFCIELLVNLENATSERKRIRHYFAKASFQSSPLCHQKIIFPSDVHIQCTLSKAQSTTADKGLDPLQSNYKQMFLYVFTFDITSQETTSLGQEN